MFFGSGDHNIRMDFLKLRVEGYVYRRTISFRVRKLLYIATLPGL